MVNGLVLLAVILFLPNGIVSLPERLRAGVGRRGP
jgi:ABC-type branched-subunit amino acid transport system permease subunit